MDEAPYRRPHALACPSCKEFLVPSETDTSQRCPKTCGEWCDQKLVEEQWGNCVDIDGDPRLRWRHSNEPTPCLQCGKPMSRVINSAWIAHRCREHGVWFTTNSRAMFEQVHVDDIKRHLEHRRHVMAVDEVVRQAVEQLVAGDPRAIRDIAERLVDLERWKRTLDDWKRDAESKLEELSIDIDRLRPWRP
jgi:hypothetical protein